jgi:hypothetical protein
MQDQKELSDEETNDYFQKLNEVNQIKTVVIKPKNRISMKFQINCKWNKI